MYVLYLQIIKIILFLTTTKKNKLIHSYGDFSSLMCCYKDLQSDTTFYKKKEIINHIITVKA